MNTVSLTPDEVTYLHWCLGVTLGTALREGKATKGQMAMTDAIRDKLQGGQGGQRRAQEAVSSDFDRKPGHPQ